MKGIMLILCILSIWTLSFQASKIVSSRKDFAHRIIGGDDAREGQFPFSAAIYLDTEDGTYFCGGALISNNWILTAGQCVDGAILFTIYLGTNNLEANDPNRFIVATSDYQLHPDYNPQTLENDVGLIRLRESVIYNNYIQRILLPFDYPVDYTVLTGIGWGQTGDTMAGLSEQLQYVTVASIPNVECQVVYGDQISDNMVCVAGQYNEGTCSGDSGSPLLEDNSVSRSLRHVGIASFISANGCESTDPSGYTKTYAHIDWIRNITNL